MPAILFVCLGNICRSPMAEAVLAHLVSARPDADRWRIDSAGTGDWHVGDDPDPRTVAECRRRGVPIRHAGRQVKRSDFADFDRILAMDRRNLADLQALMPAAARAQLDLLGSLDPQGAAEVPDPYYGGADGFARVFDQVERCCRVLLERTPPAPRR